MDTLNRSAIMVKPKQPFLEWLHAADPSSRELSLPDLVREPTIYLIPECVTDEEVADVLHDLCEEIFEEQLAGWVQRYLNLASEQELRGFLPLVRLSAPLHASRSLR